MFGKFGSLLSFRGHFIGRNGATCKRRQSQIANWQLSTASEQLESRQLLTLVPGFDINVSQQVQPQADPSIAVNPINPQNMIATYNGGAGDDLGVAYTLDGGQTWIRNPIDAFDDGVFTTGGTARFDGVVNFDKFGNAHLAYVVRDLGTTGQYSLVYANSTSGGASFTTRVIEPFQTAIFRTAITSGPDASNLTRETVVVTYTNNNGLNAKGATVSSLGSVGTFSTAVVLAGSGNFTSPAISPTGAITVAYENPGAGTGPANIMFARDVNGLQGGLSFTTTTVTSTNAGGTDDVPAMPDHTTSAVPQLAYDESNGPHRGRLYLVYADENVNESQNFEIYLRFSDNNGSTWSNRVRVNDDAGVMSQLAPSLSVDPITGSVFVGWYDARNDSQIASGSDSDTTVNTDLEFWGALSNDGGATFQPNVRISDGASNQTRDNPNPNDFGDSVAVAAYGGTAYAMWADNSNSTGDNPNTNRNFDIYFDVIPYNQPPTLTFTPDITVTGVNVFEDSDSGPLAFTVSDDNTQAASLTITATSSNQAIVRDANLIIGGFGALRSITATPEADKSGTVFITVTVNDGTLTTSETFELRVLPTPDALPIPDDAVATQWIFSDSTVIPVADNGQILATLDVATTDTYLYDVNVTVNITHTRNSDLNVVLISPAGTRVTLTSANGADFDNVFAGTLFDDQAVTTPVTDFFFEDNIVAQYVVPEGALAQLVGEDPNGTWSLEINDTLVGEAGDLNGWQLDLTTLTAAPLLQPNNGTNSQFATITDAFIFNGQTFNGGRTSTLAMNGLDPFTFDVNLSVNISHTNNADLDIYLVSPAGTEVAITTGNGGNFDNVYRTTTFDDQGPTPVTDAGFANNISIGTVIPEAALAGFLGENPNGTWTLRIVDHSPTGTGSLLSWSLDITTIFLNDSPTIGTIINPGAVPEDSAEQTVNFNSVSAGGGESQPIRVTAVSNNTALIPSPTVTYTSPNSSGSIAYTPVANEFGVAVITVYVEDGGYDQDVFTPNDNAITTRQFTVVVNPVNDLPTMDPIVDPAPIFEDSGAQQLTVTGLSSGGAEDQPLQVVALSNLPDVISNPTVEYNPGSGFAILHYQPNHDFNGTVTITVKVTDGGLDNDLSTTVDNSTLTQTFVVEIIPVNDLPTLGFIPDPTPIAEDSPTQTIGLSGITAGGNEAQDLRITAVSSNPLVVPDLAVNYISPNSVGSLSFVPLPNAFGSTVITVTVEDGGSDGLLSTPIDNTFATRDFTITVTQVNDAPVFDDFGVLAPLAEDAGLQTLILGHVSPGPFENQPVVFSVTSSNTALIPTPTINYVSPNTSGSLQFSVTPNSSGGSLLTITLTDGGLDNDLQTPGDNQTFTRQVVVTVLPVNDSPTLNPIADPAPVDEDAQAQTIFFDGITAGGGENQPLMVVATSNFPSIVPDPVVNYTPGAGSGSLTFTPLPDQYGTATISVTVTDGGFDNDLQTTIDNVSTTRTFLVNVNPVNDPPHFDFIPDPAPTTEDSGAQAIDIFGVTAGNNEVQQLQFTAVSSNPTVLPNPNIGYFQGSSSASMNYQAAPGQSGTVIVTVTVTDPGLDGDFDLTADNLTYSQDFVVVINQINDPPTINSVTSPNPIQEDAVQQTVNLSGLNSGDVGQVFQVTASSSNTTLIPNGNIVINHTGSNSTGTVRYTPAANQSGSATITVTVTDGGLDNNLATTADNLSNSTTFNVQVNPVNDNPTLNSLGGTYDISEDATIQTLTLTGVSAGGGETQPVAITVESLNTALIPTPTISYTSPNTTGTLTFTPLANKSGSATIRVRLEDGGLDGNLATTNDNGVTVQDLVVNVAEVNDAPTLNAVTTPLSIPEDFGPTTIGLSGISAGGGEVQSVQITAVSDNPSVVPNPSIIYVDGQPTASLTFTPADNRSGTANITITAEDAGGAQTLRVLTVVVTPINDAPTINSLGGPVTIDEDAAEQAVNLSGISGGPNETNQVFNVTVSSNRPDIIPDPTLVYTPGNATGLFRYQPLADQNGQVILTVRLTDGGADNNLSTTADNLTTTATLTVNVTSEPEIPILTIDQGSLFVPGGGPTSVAPGAQLSDSDSNTFNNGSVNFSLTEGAQAGDQLRLQAFGSGSSRVHATRSGLLKLGKNVIGNVTGGRGGAAFVVSFTADVDQNTVEKIIRNVQFRGKAAEKGLRKLRIVVTDNTGLTSIPQERTVVLN